MSYMKLEIQFYKGEFKSASAFPLPNTEYTPLYLNAENHTLNHAKISSAYVAQYDSEDKRQDVSFKYTFDKDTELVGKHELKTMGKHFQTQTIWIYLQVLKVRSSW